MPSSALFAPAVVLVMVFGVCWAPFHADRLMWSFVAQWTEELLLAFQYLHVISGIFFYLGSAANPVLYSIMSSRFREAFREALGLGAWCSRHQRQRGSRSFSRGTMGSTLYDLGCPAGRVPLAGGEGLEKQQETDLARVHLEVASPCQGWERGAGKPPFSA